jgi:peroxiredoxin
MNLSEIPDNIPIPEDDGAADHLVHSRLPELTLRATNNELINIGKLAGIVVLYIYPMTGKPDTPLPHGWNEIAGARGCTPQSCGFRDHYSELQTLNTSVFGISVQETDYQLEAKERLNLPFELISDSKLLLKSTLNLPTFIVQDMELYKRITLIAKDGNIEKVFYPIFPPNENVDAVIKWLSEYLTQDKNQL